MKVLWSVRRRLAAAALAVVAVGGAGGGCSGGTTSGRTAGSPRSAGATPATAAPGRPPGESAGDPFTPGVGNRGYHVRHYDLRLAIDPANAARELAGTATISAGATQPLSAFSLDLAGLTVSSVSVDGRPAGFARRGEKLIVTPGRVLTGDFTVAVTYAGTPATINDPALGRYGWITTPGGVFVADEPSAAHTWFPCDDHPDDKATYDFEITVPSGYDVVANGEPAPGPKGSSHWHEADPMATYLATVDVGHFDIRQGRTPKGTPEIVAVARQTTVTTAQSLFTRVSTITDAWSELFGPYPFASTGAIVGDADVRFALETQDRPIFAAFGANDPTVIAHELAHQWFGDSVSLDRWQDIWLNEGFATYAEWLWGERSGGETIKQQFADHYLPATDPRWQVPTADPGSSSHLFDSFAVYARGAMALQVLREKVGDATFWTILRSWAADHRHGNATTADFLHTVAQVAHQDLSPLLNPWLYGRTRPPP